MLPGESPRKERMPNFNRTYPIAEAERGKFVPLTVSDLSTLGMTVTGSRGRYALLTLDVGAPNGSQEFGLTMSGGGISAVTFSPASYFIEVYNNDDNQKVFVSFSPTTSTYAEISSRGMVVRPDSYYSITRATSSMFIGASGSGGGDVRVVSHYRG